MFYVTTRYCMCELATPRFSKLIFPYRDIWDLQILNMGSYNENHQRGHIWYPKKSSPYILVESPRGT
jgi:hypothetical protein